MKLAPFRIAALFATALPIAPAPAAPVAAQPGYHCDYQQQGDYGRLSADFEVPQNGQPSPPAYLRWEAVGQAYPGPQVSAAFYRMPDGHYRIENGYAAISWSPTGLGRNPRTLSLQLRSRPEAPRYTRGAIASAFERGGPLHLEVDWSDMAAFARGARELHVVAVDRHYRLVGTTPIDRSVFERAEPHIVTALGELERLIAHPAGTCEFLEDLRSNDVVLTSAH